LLEDAEDGVGCDDAEVVGLIGLEAAIDAQRQLIEDFAAIARDLADVMSRLEGTTFVKRLKSASRSEAKVGAGLSTAVAGGPFIGLLGTVWGVMETFSGIAKAASASLTAMAPGVAGALIATVVGLFVAIPAMFAYNFMVTTIRAITQELDSFATEYAIAIEHGYVDNRPLGQEITEANKTLVTEIAKANEQFADRLVSALRGPAERRA